MNLNEFNRLETLLKEHNHGYIRKDEKAKSKALLLDYEKHTLIIIGKDGKTIGDAVISQSTIGSQLGFLEIAGKINKSEYVVEGELTAREVLERIESVESEVEDNNSL